MDDPQPLQQPKTAEHNGDDAKDQSYDAHHCCKFPCEVRGPGFKNTMKAMRRRMVMTNT